MLFFLVAVGVVALVVAFAVSRNNDRTCVDETIASARDQDRSDAEAFAIFIAEHEEGPLPLTPWTSTTDPNGDTTYTSDRGGHWTVKVSRGAVRSFSGCSD